MKTYKVWASYTSYCTAEIEASSQEEAWQIARNLDGGDFEPAKGWEGEWRMLVEVTQIKE